MATTPYPFVASTVLTALQLNSTFNIPTTTKTASHTFIAADAGTRVIMNAAGSTSFTLDSSIFAASDVIELQNIGAGVATVTAGTATVSSAGPLAIPQNGGGRLVFSSASAATYFPTAVTQIASVNPGLVCVKAETAFSAVANFTADSVFSSTYTNYRILVNYTTGSTNGTGFQLRAGGVDTTANYNGQELDVNNTTITGTRLLANTDWYVALPTNGSFRANLTIDLFSPNVAIATSMQTYNYASFAAFNVPRIKITYGNQSDSTQFDGFKIINAGNLTGNYAVYAFSKTV